MKLKEIKPDLVLWHLTPQIVGAPVQLSNNDDLKAMRKKDKDREGRGYFYVDIWDCQAELLYAKFGESGFTCHLIDDFDHELIEKWQERNDVSLSFSGHYAIDEVLRRAILGKLQPAGVKDE